ncbi:MAG: hypothetical protein JJ934_11425 [Pseudomonadales bacterium]|nr:hypothetical protein [Pseudomonadales bacterium]MBO6822117.1 hypothetical protein [Pseudomonadales bacterium]
MMRAIFSVEFIMSNDAKQTAQELADGLKRLGPNRVVALSVHKSKELIEELEEKANRLVELLNK